MTDQQIADTQQDDQELEALKKEAKELGITQAANMKKETLIKRIDRARLVKNETADDLEIQIIINPKHIEKPMQMGMILYRAMDMKPDKITYDKQNKTFICIRGGKVFDKLKW